MPPSYCKLPVSDISLYLRYCKKFPRVAKLGFYIYNNILSLSTTRIGSTLGTTVKRFLLVPYKMAAKMVRKQRSMSGGDENACSVCHELIEIFAVGACDHPICYRCSTRMRILCDQKYCPVCRTQLPKVRLSGIRL